MGINLTCFLFGHKWFFCDCGANHKDSYNCCRCEVSMKPKEYADKYKTYNDSFEIDLEILQEMVQDVKDKQREAWGKFYN